MWEGTEETMGFWGMNSLAISAVSLQIPISPLKPQFLNVSMRELYT
jgi:hypothetical protein